MDARPRWTPYALAAIVVLGAAALWTQAVQIHLWAPDEEYFVQLSRLLTEHFPSAVVDLPVQPFDERGIQRLTILLLAVPLGVIGGETGIELGRALMCLAFTSAAIPGYLLARGVRLPAGWAVATAGLCVLVPWAVLTGTFLTESVAYPAALWAVWGAWRACVVPGWRSDLLAIALVVVAGLARTNLLVLITVAPIAVTLQTLAGAGLRRLPAQLWRDHPVFAVLIVPGAIVVVLNLLGIRPGPLGSLAGNYVTSLDLLDISPIPAKFAGQIAPMLTGLGILPVLVGVPWIARQLVRRTAPELGALAITALVAFLVVLFSTVYAAPEERYLMLGVPALLVCGVAAIARREVAAWAIAACGVLSGVLVWRVAWGFITDPTFFAIDASETFVGRVVLSRMPGDGQLAGGLLVVAAGFALALALGRGRATRAPLVVLGLVIAIQLVQTAYVVTKRVDVAGGAGTLPDWTWVDDRVGGAKVGIHAVGIANGDVYDGTWRETHFFNRNVESMVALGAIALQIPRYGEVVTVDVDERTGRLRPVGDATVPRYLLEPAVSPTQGVLADRVAQSSYLPVRLVRLRGAPRVTYQWQGGESDGWLSSRRRRAAVAVTRAALEAAPRACLTVTLAGPPAEYVTGRARYLARGPGVRREGEIGPDGRATVTLPVREGDERLSVIASGFGETTPDGRRLGVRVLDTAVQACDA